jgi:hypothetical protein
MSDFIGLVLAFTALLLWTCVLPTLGLLWLFGWLT